MIEDLNKLATFLKKMKKLDLVSNINEIIKTSANPEYAPELFEIQKPGDLVGDWDYFNEVEPENLPTDEISKEEMFEKHKPTQGTLDVIRMILSKSKQHLLKIKWHQDDDYSEPFWLVSAASNDPTDLPRKILWAFFEVSPTDPRYEFGIDIPDKNKTRIYSE